MFKFDLNKLVYYMQCNKIYSGQITSRMIIENLHDDWANTDVQKSSWQPFGPTEIKYKTCHGIFNESDLFSSKEDLANSLLNQIE